MKITYKGIPLQLIYIKYNLERGNIDFLFTNEDVMVEFFRRNNKWHFGLLGNIPETSKETNTLLQWILSLDTFEKRNDETSEFFDYILKTPLRLKILMELGPDAYKKYK